MILDIISRIKEILNDPYQINYDWELSQLPLSSKDENNLMVSHFAAYMGENAVLSKVLELGIDKNAIAGRKPLFEWEVKGESLGSQLYKGIVASYSQNTPLICAVYAEQYETAKTLIENEADVDIPDGYGNTALHYAMEMGNESLIDLLMTAKAEINTTNKGKYSPLAAMLFSPDVPSELKVTLTKKALEYGADPNTVGNGNYTPLHSVLFSPDENISLSDKLEIVKLLLKHGAAEKINNINIGGYTPLATFLYGRKSQCKIATEISDLLIEHGAENRIITPPKRHVDKTEKRGGFIARLKPNGEMEIER